MSAVLIETLWNVKIAKVYQIDEKSRINRNIVECKDVSGKSCLMLLSRINRNIVECKDRSKKLVTYWLQSINRNIVECKEHIEKSM